MNLEELMASTPPMQQHALIKGFQAGAASRDAEIAELVAALETVIANAPEPYCAITRAVDAQCRAALAKMRKP